jgi:hypothetical protein
MNIALQTPWTAVRFFRWSEAQDGRYEFDGIRTVAMTGSTIDHAIIVRNLHRSLDTRLRGSQCTPLCPDGGLATVGDEIVSPTGAGVYRIIKVAKYAAVSTILRYVIVESTSYGLLELHRIPGENQWRANPLTEADDLLCRRSASGYRSLNSMRASTRRSFRIAPCLRMSGPPERRNSFTLRWHDESTLT